MLGRIKGALKAIGDWQDRRFVAEVARTRANHGASLARPVDLDRPHALQTKAGQILWVEKNHAREGVEIHIDAVGTPKRILKLHHTEAQWLLKAIRQQNNIVKQRLGIAPYDEDRGEFRSEVPTNRLSRGTGPITRDLERRARDSINAASAHDPVDSRPQGPVDYPK